MHVKKPEYVTSKYCPALKLKLIPIAVLTLDGAVIIFAVLVFTDPLYAIVIPTEYQVSAFKVFAGIDSTLVASV